MENVRFFDGLKFMWDGAEYSAQADALLKRDEYEKEGFSVQAFAESGKHFLFSRRLVKETAVTQGNVS